MIVQSFTIENSTGTLNGISMGVGWSNGEVLVSHRGQKVFIILIHPYSVAPDVAAEQRQYPIAAGLSHTVHLGLFTPRTRDV